MFSGEKSSISRKKQSSLLERKSDIADQRVETYKRLEEFTKFFVKECEAKLSAYHLILKGELQKAGKFSDTFSGIIGQGLGGVAGIIVGYFLGSPLKGANVLAKAGKAAGEKLGNELGNAQHANKVTSLYDIIECFQKDKYRFRKILVEAAFDIFQSFEIQCMRMTSDKGPKKAMNNLAKDAVNRTFDYLRCNKFAFVSESVILGKSEKQTVYSTRPGFEVKYEYQTCRKTWCTASLYSKVGLLVIQGGKSLYNRKKNSCCDTGKYGYRRLLTWETWNKLHEEYERDNIAESESSQFTDYTYILDPNNLEVITSNLLEKINLDDKDLAEKRLKEVLDEVRKGIIEELNCFKQVSGEYSEDRERVLNMETNLECLNTENLLQEMRSCLEESLREIHRQNQIILAENEQQHKKTQVGVKQLNEGIKVLQGEQAESKEVLKEAKRGVERIERLQSESHERDMDIIDHVKYIKRNTENLLAAKQFEDKERVWFGVREPVKSFIGRLEQLSQIAVDVQQEYLAITGLSGVGKTELAIKYAHDHYDQDGNIIWINAETRETTKESFHRLCKKLGLKVKDNDGLEKDLSSIAEDLYTKFSNSKSLFIFDDVESYAAIKDVMPRFLPKSAKKPNVLITSNNLQIQGIKTLLLDDFTPSESEKFLRETLNLKDSSTLICETERLTKKLHNFPLALDSAVAYIAQENKKLRNVHPEGKYTISDYLDEYEGNTETLLKSEALKNFAKDYDKTTLSALQITFGKVKHHAYVKPFIEVPHIMAFLRSENIPAEMFLELVNSDERKLGSAIQVMKDYSIIKGEGLLKMHGLVQQAVRLELEKENEEIIVEVLSKALKLLQKFMVDHESIESYVPHITSVWNCASKYDVLTERYIVNDVSTKETYTTYFHSIAEYNQFEILERVIKSVEDVYPSKLCNVINQESNKGVTPLHCAALSGDERKVTLLIDKGAFVNAERIHKWTPLHFAAKNGYLACVTILSNHGAVLNSKTEYGFSPLHFAAKGGHLQTLEYLSAGGADINAKTNRGFTALHFAVDNGEAEIFSILLEKGARIDDKTRHQLTALHMAAKKGYTELVSELIERRAQAEPGNLRECLEAKTRFKYTPLHMAAQNGHLRIVKILLSYGVTPDPKDTNHFTPLHLAAFGGYIDIVNVLLYNNASINSKTNKGNTPLHLAAENDQFDVVKALMEKMVDVYIRNQEGKTAKDLAFKKGHQEIYDYFVQYGQHRGNLLTKEIIEP